MPTDGAPAPAIPLADVAGRWLAELAGASGSAALSALDGATLLGERARINRFAIPGEVSAGGGCRLLPCTENGWIALNLARPDDCELLPALFGATGFDPHDWTAVAREVRRHRAITLVERGREMGLAIAHVDERPGSAACEMLVECPPAQHEATNCPLVVDLSALWAGPLAGHLFWLAGARVIKVEAPHRADTMRSGDPQLFGLLNQGKASVTVDLRTVSGRAQLGALLSRADIVIEAARPRALLQLGIDAEASVRARPGQVWIGITAHGARAPHCDAVGFGDDCGVAGGLTRALADAAGSIGFVGDAIADPLTGIAAARAGWQAFRSRRTCRIGVSMSATVAAALAEKRALAGAELDDELRRWAQSAGRPFPAISGRAPTASVRPLGADNAAWLGAGPC